MPWDCSVCPRPDRASIDEALLGRTTLRSVAKTFGLGRTAISNHAAHIGALEQRQRSRAARGLSRRKKPATPLDIKPIAGPDDVVEDLQRLRVAAYELFEGAKERSDWKQAQLLFGQLVQIIDRFGDMHKVLGAKGVTLNVDQRTQKIVAMYDSLPVEVLRALKTGETTIEAVIGSLEVVA